LAENGVFFLPLSYSTPPLSIFPVEFHGEVKRQETRVMELLCSEVCVILTSTVFDWSTRVTDRRNGTDCCAVENDGSLVIGEFVDERGVQFWTDGQTDGRMMA